LPRKLIGKILIVSVVMAVVWYMLMILSVSLALDPEQNASSTLSTADAMTALFGGSWAEKILVLAGVGGIITSWNAFLIGGSRAVFAMAQVGMLPPFLAKLHPKHKTPVNAVLMIGALSVIAPLFGRKTLVWLVDAGGLGIVVAYAFVAASFIVLRKREPHMERPFRVAQGMIVGCTALLLSLGLILLYMPGSPAALVWPHEWAMVGGWSLLGFLFYVAAKRT